MGEFCRRTVSTIWHYHGGCLVGKVVDRNFRVIGIDALRVVDGSIFTVSPGLMTVRGVDNLLVCWYEDTQRENEIELTTYPVTLLCQKELVAYFAANLLAIYQSNRFNSLLILRRFRVTYLFQWLMFDKIAASIVYNLLKSGLACSSLLNLFGFSTASSREFTSSTRLRGAVDINWNVSITVLELIRLPASDMAQPKTSQSHAVLDFLFRSVRVTGFTLSAAFEVSPWPATGFSLAPLGFIVSSCKGLALHSSRLWPLIRQKDLDRGDSPSLASGNSLTAYSDLIVLPPTTDIPTRPRAADSITPDLRHQRILFRRHLPPG
ncbi:hypothetical protein G4B88_002345 (mitochondrion) [Cannabis sativa]|uniref:Glucose-methanol-choline oxidoreductase C-terminal domain-containing protein n=1 Tax=Cannabis sativa TaxID=3483 RepID=A0A7J6DV07_CANSA|nr:hypothetical protein G4B88_002345 [Cannabis sativa]